MSDPAHFKAVLDGTLEEQIFRAYRCGFEGGYTERKTNPEGDLRNHDVGSSNWVINVAYGEWQYRQKNLKTKQKI